MKREFLTIGLIAMLCLFGFKQSESQNAEVVDTEVQNSELQTQVPQTGKTPSSVASSSNSGALQVIGTKLCDSSGNPHHSYHC